MGDAKETLTKVHVSFGARGGESMWAKPIEGDLYAIRNLPFFAFGLNFGDIVLAPDMAGIREVQTVVRPSGHRTLRLVFGEHVTQPEQRLYLDALQKLGGTYERGTKRLVAIDVPPGADFDAMLVTLDRCEAAGELSYETCEARVTGSFDDAAQADAAA
jgi:hypothetical protein